MRWVLVFWGIMLGVFEMSMAQLPPDTIAERLLSTSIKDVLGKEASVQWRRVEITETERKQFKRLFPEDASDFYIGHLSEEPPLDVMIAQARGKVELFVFAIYFHAESGEIWEVDVLDYREAYGGEIDYKAFRRQFKGKTNPKEIVFRRTIRNISGATISARSITRKVKEVLAFYQYYRQRSKESTP